jgi:glutamine amidotransferase
MSRPVAIGIVDYGMGNRRSVQKAFEHVGAETRLTADAELLRASDGLVVPGVGAFPQGMRNLADLGLDELIRSWDGPLLGICLGMQLLFESSDEMSPAHPTPGLGLIAGQVTRLQTGGLRIPHIGWNEVGFARASALTEGLPVNGCPFYHVHSFAARPARPDDIIGTTAYGERFATIVGHGSVLGVQFHPEKSSADGLRLLANFVRMCGAPRSEAAGSVSLRA